MGKKHSAGVAFVFPILRIVTFLIFLFFCAPIRVFDRKRVPKSGSLLIISNHISNTDPILAQYSSPRLVHFLARKELFDMGLLGKFIRWWRAIPIKQSSADKGAIKTAIEVLKSGEAVAIFPEGQLSPDGKLIELFEGTALIIRLSGAPCICVGLRGSNKVMPHPSVIPRWAFSRVSAHWGDVRQFSRNTPPEEIMEWIEVQLKTLNGELQSQEQNLLAK